MLRELKIKDIPQMMEWMSNKNIISNFVVDFTKLKESDLEEFINSSITSENIHFAIVNDTDEYMGTISLKKISNKDGTAEFAIVLRECAQNQGIGFAASKELLKYAFNIVGIEKVYLNVLEKNVNAIKLYEKLGFLYEGTFKDHIVIDGERQSIRWYALHKRDEI